MTMMNPFSTKLIKNLTKWCLNLMTNLIPPLLISLKKSLEPSTPCNWEQLLALHDQIQPEHLRYGGTPLVHHLSTLFNLIVNTEYIPWSFQQGLIIPIPKSLDKDPSDPSNYCGITLQSVIAKVFEKIILLRLLDPNIHDLIHPLQGGFKPDVSCLHTAFVFQEAVQHLRDHKEKAYVALSDVQKAFDTVWHNGLFHKLYSYGIKGHTWWILRKWYQSTTCTVLLEGEQSNSFNIKQGVKQGAVLFPCFIACLSTIS